MNGQGAKPFRGFASESRFDRETFLSPSVDYAPIYTWMWNDRITREETDRNLAEMAQLGIKRLYVLPMPKTFRPTSFPTILEPDYLSQEYLDEYRHAFLRAKEYGMQLWLYDEGGWPSGGACGQVMLEDPTLVTETIRTEDIPLNKGQTYRPTHPTEAAFVGEKRIESGYMPNENCTVTEYTRVRTSFPYVRSADIPDITKKGATELFLTLTHEKYASVLSDLFGESVTAVFTDEPTAPRPFPYNDEIKDLFRREFHEEIEDHLPTLMGKATLTEKSARIKIKFFELMSALFCDRFLDKEKVWAHDHGLAYLGHLDKDDETNGSMTGGNFQIMRALRHFDVPGVDAIRRQIFPPKGKRGLCGENKFFPLCATSAAAQTGGRHALSESFAVYGEGLSYDEMRYALNFQAMRGINLFNLMVVPYARKGYRAAGLLPHFTEKTHPDLAIFNEYVSRLSYLFSLGDRVANTAIYLPIADGVAGNEEAAASYEALGKESEARRIPFDVIDDDFLSFAKTERSRLTAGKASYETVILPDCDYLSETSIGVLSRFVETGGRVLTPSDKLSKRITGVTHIKDLSGIASPLPLSADAQITLAQSRTEAGDLFFLMNESGSTKRIDISLPADTLYLLSPVDGSIRRPATEMGQSTITLQSGEIVALYQTEESLPAEKCILPKNEILLSDWQMRPTKRLTLEEEYELRDLDEESRPISLGDRCRVLGEGFSGTCEYETTFSLPTDPSRAVLDLGKVVQTEEVLLNDVSLGKRILPPYRFTLPIDLLRRRNDLRVRVTGTAANAFESTKAFDRCRPWQLGNYIKEERAFHQESLESGLFGEVKIFYE